MREVLIEIKSRDGWQHLSSISEVEPPGSISSYEPSGRQVYVFGWHGDDGPCVWRSVAGIDVENVAVRAIATAGLDLLGDLTAGPVEIAFWRKDRSVPVRFRLEGG